MIKTTSKIGLGLALLAMILAGCTATQEVEPEPADVGTRGVQFPEQTSDPVEEAIENTFYFDFDKSTLSDKTKFLLRRHAEQLSRQPVAITLEGHADERGTREYNMALGERRAEAVRGFLLGEGVTVQIEVISFGEEEPAVVGSNEEAWALNRRVELKYDN